MNRLNKGKQVFAAATIGLILAVTASCGGGGSGIASPSGTPNSGGNGGGALAPIALQANLVLGAPTDRSIRLALLTTGQSGSASLQFGTSAASLDQQSTATAVTAGEVAQMVVEGLQPDMLYYYRLQLQMTGGTVAQSDTYRFHTARPAGSTFTFTVQADSHLDENADLDVYRRTLGNVLADQPDFHIDLGDTFMCEKHSAPLTAVTQTAPDAATVDSRYRYERGNFGLTTHSTPLFLVNGNHEGEAGWLNDGTAQNLAVWTTQARQRYFVNPLPNAFYSGDTVAEPFVGQRASWYAWQWGDALFIVLDPFWNSLTQPNKDAWGLTLGERQYTWLKQTLASSKAKYKFVFIHNLVGGLDGQMRGGAEAAPYFEWGGLNADGSAGFSTRRPGWSQPIHALLVANGVNAVFHGHDHLYAYQVKDGVVYQEVPQPSARNTFSGATLASQYHYESGTIRSSAGHLRVTVSPGGVTARYIRSWLPASENAIQINGQIEHQWTLGSP